MLLTRRTAIAAGLAGASNLAAGGAHAQPARWQFATPYPDSNYHTRNNKLFAEELEKASGGRLAVAMQVNGALLPMPQIKGGAQRGQVQLGEILLSAYGNEDPFFEVDGIPQLVSNFAEARKLYELSKPFVEARFARQGIVPLYSVPWPPSGFYTNAALEGIEGLRGTRMRTFNVMTGRFATLVGATPTLVQAAELPQAFATGVVNAMVTSSVTGVDTAAWDYAKFYTPVGFTLTRNVVFVNKRAMDALAPDLQATLRTAAASAETRGWGFAEEASSTTRATLASRGMTVAQPSAALMDGMARVSRTMVDEWLVRTGEDGQKLIAAYRA